MAVIILLVLTLVLVLAIAFWPQLREMRRDRWRRQAFPAHWRRILRQRVPGLRRLPADLQIQLRKQMQVFLAEKPFIGCAGLVVTEEMRVVIAAQACLLLLNRRTDVFANLREILVYPDAFVVDRLQTDGLGLQHEARHVLSGQSSSRGQVILSWADVLQGAAIDDDGRNVVLHEFAHQLDQETGSTNGAPDLSRNVHPSRWARVMRAEYDRLRASVEAARGRMNDGVDTESRWPAPVLDAYGATDPAEFFAVATESFIEKPGAMATVHPELYAVLRDYYAVDPANW